MSNRNQRIMRIPIPVPLIRQMDDVITREIGGYSTRSEFIVDAIQERILELTVDSIEGGTPGDAAPSPLEAETAHPDSPATAQSDTFSEPTTPPYGASPTAQMTALPSRSAGFSLADSDNISCPTGRVLFGFHNRDYPALWALNRLANMASEEPIPLKEFEAQILEEAWKFGELLTAIERNTGTKCTALFPTNDFKRKAAELAFRQFAIGDYRPGEADTITTSGPLFEWRVVGLSGLAAKPRISLTAAGWNLIANTEGLTVEQPHLHSTAVSFLAHLEDYAPADRSGFIEIIRTIGTDGAARKDVLDHVASVWTEWTKNETSTNAGGYIARAREWGLIQPKQTESKYHLTSLGCEYLTGGE